jgi:hypothetical protein
MTPGIAPAQYRAVPLEWCKGGSNEYFEDVDGTPGGRRPADSGRSTMTATALRGSGAGPQTTEALPRWMHVLAAVVLPVGPAAVAILRFVLPYATVDEPAAMAAGVAADPGAQSLVIWLGLLGALTIPASVIWIGRLTYARAHKLTVAALALAVPGYTALGAILASDVMLYAGADNGLDPQTLAALVSNSHPAVAVAEVVFVLGHLVGTVLLGAALWRSRVVPVWAAILTTVSQPLHLVAAVFVVSHSLDLAAWLMTAAGFAAAGMASLARTRQSKAA